MLLSSLGFLHLSASAQQNILGKMGFKDNPILTVSAENSKKGTRATTKRTDKQAKRPSTIKSSVTPLQQSAAVTDCLSIKPAQHALQSSTHPIIRKLWEYQQVCQGDFLNHAMVFTAIPDSHHDVAVWAGEIAHSLKEFAVYGLEPLVVLEPSKNLDLQAFSRGEHDEVMRQYFKTLKSLGVTDASMGQWVLFPEANIPAWGNTDPNVFANNVTRTAHILKNEFPAAKATIMLDSKTYPSDDLLYVRGRYVSLLPYVRGIPPGLLDSFGFQGFPWVPPANAVDIASIDPAVFLNASLAVEAAAVLGVEKIWLNTGSFQTYYASSDAKRVLYAPQNRQSILVGIVEQAKRLKNSGYSVSMNLFSEDKSLTAEGVNWSYWQDGAFTSSPHTYIFRNFTAQLTQAGIPLGVFDTYH